GLERILYNRPGLTVDLGVGLWAQPLPMDYDSDGDMDLVVNCADVPYKGTYFFENAGGDATMPVFKRAVRIDRGMHNVQISHVDGGARVLSPGIEYHDFLNKRFSDRRELSVQPNIHPNKVRANQWKYADYDGDGRLDLIVGVGDWSEYGWDNAFNEKGEWTNGPLHGYVYLLKNAGTNEAPQYEPPAKLMANEQPVDVYGMPSPNLADFDGDGDLDLLCGEFVDTLTYFQNEGTRSEPRYAAGRKVSIEQQIFRADLCMIIPVAVDWDNDGDPDIVLGQEDGRVIFLEHTGKTTDGMPQFSAPRFFQQEAEAVKFGALVTPVGVDWDGDGDGDLVCGNSAGRIAFIENLGGFPPRWAPPHCIEAGGEVIQIMAGPGGSIQGPCETKWGYTTLSVADWDHDERLDLVVNSIWGRVLWYRNVGTRTSPRLAAAAAIDVQWPEDRPPKPAWVWWEPQGKQLATQWRTTPVVVDLNRDGLNDLVMLDHEGYLAFFEREKKDGDLQLLPPRRIFDDAEKPTGGSVQQVTGKADDPLRLNNGVAGRSGRRKLCAVDWDQDGTLDLLANSRNINFLRGQAGDAGRIVFRDMGMVDSRVLAGHTTSPTTVDWDGNGVPDLVVGAEDGFLYYLKNPNQ
ncbi:MAG: FG-GAP repeat domain-containing protein, partial [Pirellulaceae bacterium]